MKKLILILGLIFLVGCQQTTGLPEQGENQELPDDPQENYQQDAKPEEPEEPQEELDFQAVRPNEAGQVMVLMYHEIGGTESTWRRTTENFRQDLKTLYDKGYRPVNLNDYLAGHIDIPAGTTPFILTFDDGTAGQFRFLEDGDQPTLDPDSAVAIILEMAEKYDDFNPAGTFYIYYPVPFRQQAHIQTKLEMLVEWGFEIGNHTYGHENLRNISPQEVTEALARHVRATQSYLPGYEVNTLALPYGALPEDDSLLTEGTWEDITYKNDAILLVGANPAPSPFSEKFNPLRLPRVRADGTELPRWLEYFENNTQARYISDGNPDKVTVPRHLEENINEKSLGDRAIRTYQPD
ncbi:polysaccharide deacetylase family protein [Dethiobacter alkaliphilus]|uniref:Polysaccharide deacetylase n=1 Tax=Dethiobacter alkaliphilus AHT 1 TaxID=555088 RepID=C0GIT2_DETAL|nr:polysaccharide deacetylase family protein [Dethiobacter alkaliphilus]EEG76746.1 polysaccharide deacetylase [Dethiobacter alkaliphilus AHT 1]